jgi:hypothetical protein
MRRLEHEDVDRPEDEAERIRSPRAARRTMSRVVLESIGTRTNVPQFSSPITRSGSSTLTFHPKAPNRPPR